MADYELNYVEFYTEEVEKTQAFMKAAFDWEFVDYGSDYKDIQGAGMGGGIARQAQTAPLPIVHASDLEAAFDRVKKAGATITKDIFAFPGGRRFEFREPGGNEMAVWSQD